jgi:hypothetical protein
MKEFDKVFIKIQKGIALNFAMAAFLDFVQEQRIQYEKNKNADEISREMIFQDTKGKFQFEAIKIINSNFNKTTDKYEISFL